MADEVTTSPVAETPEAAPEAQTPVAEPEESTTGQQTPEESPASETPAEDNSGESETTVSDSEQRATETAKQQAIELRQLKRQLRDMQQRMERGNNGQQQRIPQPPAMPKLEDYDDVTKFNEDLEKWSKHSQAYGIQQDRAARAEAERKQAEAKQQADLKAQWDKRAARVLAKNPGFNVAESLGRIEPSPTMDGFFADSEVGPELVSYFDDNPEEADKIRELAPFAAVRELVKLEEKLSNQVKGIKKPIPSIKPPGQVAGRASAPAAPKTAAEVLYG